MSDNNEKSILSENFDVFVKVLDGFFVDPNGLDIFVPADMFIPEENPDGIGFYVSPFAIYQKTGERVTDETLLKKIFNKIKEIATDKSIPLEFN